jgi:hypothetical protein
MSTVQGGMNHMWISPVLDEKVVVKDATDKSRKFGPYQVHYHPEREQCQAKFRHRIFAQGHEVGGIGPA